MLIKGEIITLREYRKEDWERVHLYASLPEFTEFQAWGPNSETDTKDFINLMVEKQNQDPRYEFDLAIEHNDSGLLVGGCGLQREGVDSCIGILGYAVNPEFQKMGIATSATKLLLELGFEDLNLDVIYATCDSRNIASYTVMSKVGMERVGFYKDRRMFKNKVSDEFRYEINRERFIKIIK